VGQFLTYNKLDNSEACSVLLELLGVEDGPTSVVAWLSWLRELYEACCLQQEWVFVARAYLMHLIGCTIFPDKSVTSISVSYLSLFWDLVVCGGYCLIT